MASVKEVSTLMWSSFHDATTSDEGRDFLMNIKLIACASIVGLASISATSVQAQSWQLLNASYALKSGESVEVADFYYITNCQSALTSFPEVTVLDGPPGVTASLTEAMVNARFHGCPKPVKGAKLRLSADKVEDYSQSVITLRIKYQTKDGERQTSKSFNLTLFP
jgi:hypothetical protein